MDRIQHRFTYFLTFSIILSLAAMNVFYHLGKFPIYSWDEARHGVSAYEMMKNGNFFVNTYRGHPDYWNLKPPLSFLSILVGYKIAGFNAFGLRISSAVFSLLTIIIVTVFVLKKFGKLASIFSMLALSTNTQFLINHSSRTGDADALYVFFFTVAILSLFQSIEKIQWLYVSGLVFSLAFLTKSWHAGTIVVIMGLFLFFTGTYKKLNYRKWIFLFLSMLLPILFWAFIRFQYDGLRFFKGMLFYDLLQRSSSSIEGHVGGVFYYVQILNRFSLFWILIVLFTGLLFLFQIKKTKEFPKNEYVIGILIAILVPFLLFTLAKTKIRWYILPIYPPLSMLIGILTSKYIIQGKRFLKVVLLLAFLSVSTYYEVGILTYLQNPAPNFKQSLIEKVKNQTALRGDHLYLYAPTSKVKWLQSEVLTAELANDLHVANGNFQEFLSKKHALLLVPTQWYSKEWAQSYQLKAIASNQWGYLVKHEL
ncbi:ArnT family glycosyltransferase [Neobacillus sp. SM06]|uniref:ArnT family glycosyltransferase n=1 Tax=Neobacillus sp. SM06 TaxID=3422492 RepID=UPI003D27B1E4